MNENIHALSTQSQEVCHFFSRLCVVAGNLALLDGSPALASFETTDDPVLPPVLVTFLAQPNKANVGETIRAVFRICGLPGIRGMDRWSIGGITTTL